MMRELEVRQALHRTEVRRILDREPASLVVDELGLFEGKYRIDVAVINEKLHGYEIKSRMDNLDRLPTQQESFSRIFDRMTLVADEKHVAKAVTIVPPWWGLIAVSFKDGAPYLNEIWPSRQNLNVEPHALCQLLWREEALQLLRDIGLASGVRTKSRKLMWKLLAKVLEPDELKQAVHRILKARQGWRPSALSWSR
ncbi:MAG TPA: sce7726 family protein [Oculatellaceae cyanobacterium]